MSASAEGSVQRERVVVTHWSAVDGVGSARTVETGRDVFIIWSEMPLEVVNTLSVGAEITLDYEWAEGGQDGFDWRGVIRH